MIRVSTPDLVDVFKKLSHNRVALLNNKKIAIKTGIKLKPIRSDIFIGMDKKYYRSFVALPPGFSISFKQTYRNKDNSWDFIFNYL